MAEIVLTCRECGAQMALRRQREHPDREFYGCSRWPDCTYTREVPEHVRMTQAGAETLPGF